MKYRKIALGGTFDIIHRGHEELISNAFELGEKVLIGLSSDSLAKKLKKEAKSYEERKKALLSFLKNKKYENFEVIELNDEHGTAAEDAELEAIVVSEETVLRAFEINEIRERKNLKPLDIISIPLVLAENGKPISTKRIKRGEINKNGTRRKN